MLAFSKYRGPNLAFRSPQHSAFSRSLRCLFSSFFFVFYLPSTFSKKSSARESFDCPSQNIACLRTSGLRFVSAT